MAKVIRQALRQGLNINDLKESIQMLAREWFPLLREMRTAFNTWEHPEYRIKLGGDYLTVTKGGEAANEPGAITAVATKSITSIGYSSTARSLDAWFNPTWYPKDRHGYVDRKVYLEVDGYWDRDAATSVRYVLWDVAEDVEVTSSRIDTSVADTRQYLISDAIDVYNPDDPDDVSANKIIEETKLYRLYAYIASGSEAGTEVIGALNAHLVIRYERPT